MKRPLLIVFLGFPGSGKTYFAKKLADKLPAVTFNSDALRLAMFGSLENIEVIRQKDQSRLYTDVFGAMDYAAKQALRAGVSVIYDAQQTKRENRRGIEALARETGALPVLVWIKTSKQTALERGMTRAEDSDSVRYERQKMTMLIHRFNAVTDLPDSHENVIEISGEITFEEQYEQFMKRLGELS
jgi:predicted kinase